MLVIVPAFNEARNLLGVIANLRAAAPECDVCVVDDGSTDDTCRIARNSGVTVLQLPLNLGIGGAVQTGYLWAERHDYDVAIQIDGDGQHDPAFIAEVLAPLAAGSADMVVGSRFLSEGGFRSTTIRRAGIRYLSWVLQVRCGARATDPTSGFRAAGRKAIELFARLYPSDYPEPEAIALLRRHSLIVSEVSVRMRERQHGESSINLWRSLYYFVKVSLALLILPLADKRLGSPSLGARE